MKTFLIVDGNSILNRAFYGVKPLTTRDGRNTNALFGFINMLHKQLTELSPDYAAMAFDLREPTFRHKKCSYYKANRKGMPEELAEQLEPAKKIASLLGFHVLTKVGYEADDILGTLSADSSEDLASYIMTGDRDSFQLIGGNTFVLYASTKETSVYDTEKIKELYGGLTPDKLIDVKALMGDTSDNIPGVPGIGEKTAVALIAKYGSLDALYTALEGGDPEIKGAVRTKLENGKDSAYESRFLAEICRSVPLDTPLEELKYSGMDVKGMLDICSEYELRSIITRLGLDKAGAADDGNLSMFDIEPQVLEYTEKDLPDGFSGRVYAFIEKNQGKIYYATGETDEIFRCDASESACRRVFEDENVKTVLCNCKDAYLFLHGKGVKLKNSDFDVMLASYVADPAKVVNLDNLYSYSGIVGVDTAKADQKAAMCVSSVKKAYADFSRIIADNGQEKLFYEIEMPTSEVLSEMEIAGFKLNREGLRAFSDELEARLEERKANIYALADCEFNINSTKQLAEVLFEKLDLPAIKKTKSGFSTDAETLERLRPYHPIINEILEYRLVAKLRSTYTDALLDVADQNGRIHTSFKQAFTLTGRLSSAEPNLQNIPIRTAEGRELRKFFEACDGDHVLIDADYSQIELRLLAAMSGDENMIETYRNGLDIHASTASQVFGVPLEAVTGDLRKKAKAVNFGIIYGIGDYSLAGDIHVSRKEAAEYIKSYFAKYPKIKQYLDGAIASAREKGYSETLYGRRRYITELSAKNKNLQSFGERVAMNAPIQGTAADIIKIAMVNVHRRLKEEGLDARLVLQVHDELIVEASKEDAERAKKVLEEEMRNAAELAVPLEVQAEEGFTWFEAHS